MAEKPQAETIFGKAIEIGAVGERNAFLDGACHGDPVLRQEVDKLVHDYFRAGEFLEQPVAQIAAPTLDQPITEKPGTQIGPYKLLQQLGEGGMGVVYMAEQKDPVKRRVALKIIKPGMDTRQVIARFEAERQALAMMDHPNIAKVLDAGQTESGRPYFVMELVKGMPVTNYCDEQHLTPRERLELFVPICQAVQHAHQKGIIHRDLKPSNILVALYDGHPVPKIIDFGVAKATSQTLTEKTMFTQVGQVVGTLEYMAPEQAQVNQLDVDTRSDVYSLGVVLYELLTGETPFDHARLRSAAFDEMLRIIREEEPSKPSTKVSSSQSLPSIAANRRIEPAKLGSIIRGELDWIVLKAMEKDRGRRYETASKFAEDVQHYLNDEAVVACPPSRAYRFRKFARRNKTAIATASAVAVCLIVVAAVSTVSAIRLDRLATEKAELVDDKVILAEDLQKALDDAQANLVLAREQEQQATASLALANNEQRRAEANLDLALAALDTLYLDAIGKEKLLGDPISRPQPEDGDVSYSTPEPLSDFEKELLRRGLRFYDQFARENDQTSSAELQSAQAYYRVGLLHTALSDHAAAVSAYEAAIERFEQLTNKAPDDAGYQRQLAEAYHGLGGSHEDWPTARQAFQNEQHAWTRLVELHPNDADLFLKRAAVARLISDDQQREEHLKAALTLAPNSVEVLRKCSEFYQPSDPKKSIDLAERAVSLAPNDPRCHVRLAKSYAAHKQVVFRGALGRGQPLHRVIDKERALEHFNLAVELAPDDLSTITNRAEFYGNIGDYERALEDLTRARQLDPKSASLLYQRARIHLARGTLDDALRDITAALQSDNHKSGWHRIAAKIYLEQADWKRAFDELDLAIAVKPDHVLLYNYRAVALYQLGRYEESLADLATAVRLDPEHPHALVWICSWASLADCPDDDFKQDLIELASETVERPAIKRGWAFFYRGRLHAELGHVEESEADLSSASDLATEDPDLLGQIAYWRRTRRQWAEAIVDYTRLIELRPEESRFWDQRGRCHHALRNWEEAAEDYSRAIELGANGPQQQTAAWGHRSQAFFRLGKYEEARKGLEKTIALRGDDGPSLNFGPRWWFYAMALSHLGENDKARDYFDQLSQQLKNNPPKNFKVHTALQSEAAELLGLETPANSVEVESPTTERDN